MILPLFICNASALLHIERNKVRDEIRGQNTLPEPTPLLFAACGPLVQDCVAA